MNYREDLNHASLLDQIKAIGVCRCSYPAGREVLAPLRNDRFQLSFREVIWLHPRIDREGIGDAEVGRIAQGNELPEGAVEVEALPHFARGKIDSALPRAVVTIIN